MFFTQCNIFIAAFLAVIEHGMKDAPVMCKYTVGRKSLGLVERELRVYLQLHRQNLESYAAQVRDTLVLTINAGLDDAINMLAVDSVDLWRQHQLMPPLTEEASTNCLVVRSGLWPRAPANATGVGPGERKQCLERMGRREQQQRAGQAPGRRKPPSSRDSPHGVFPRPAHAATLDVASIALG